MRIRKKKHLEQRLAAVGNRLFLCDLEDRDFRTAVMTPDFLPLKEWFGRSAPLFLEIGCGKGGFAAEFARRNPNINLLAVEKNANVIVEACERAEREGLSNLCFLKCSAEYLPKYIPPKSVERIFLNFSCPFPKTRYASHRLTHPRFLKLYKSLCIPGAEIHQKTDNRLLFEFSLEAFSKEGFRLQHISLDLHHSNFEDNIETEYEQKFSSMGLPIYRLEAVVREEGHD